MKSTHFQQSGFWCDFKCAHGWKLLSEDDVNVLYRQFALGPMHSSIAYVPLAPVVQNQNSDQYLSAIYEFTKRITSKLPKNTLCVRFDIPLDFSTVTERDAYVDSIPVKARAQRIFIHKSLVDIQPPDSIFVALDKSEEEILSAMKSKWRYNIRYAEKHNVVVRAVHAGDPSFEADLQSFYELYKTTAKRDGIGIHPLEYYRDLLEKGRANSDDADSTKITLYIGSHEGEDLAAIITLFNKDEAVYLYGCSGNNKRNLMPAYIVQWTAIKDAKQFGSKIYDFYGIPPTADENHPMHGLYLFKSGFGGKEVHRPGSIDVPISSMYSFYVCAERFRAWYHKIFLKKIRGR